MRWALVLAGVVILGAPVLGHHSYASYYLEEDTIEVEGNVVEFQYRNPHSFVNITGQEAFGKMKTYTAEWASISRLEREGITKETLRVGDTVRIWGAPPRDPNDPRIHLKRIERRSDGWKWGQNRGEPR